MENHSQENNEPMPGKPEFQQSDAEKLAHKHLADPTHVITDEEMQNIRVGMSSSPDQPTEEAIREAKDKIADHKSDSEDDTTPGGQKMTPWDVIGP